MLHRESQGESRVRENFTHGLVGEENSCPAKAGFSLVELLVVIAIISILAALLMPALKSARESVKSIQCVNNLRQLGFALTMYAHDDNRGLLPEYTSGGYPWNWRISSYLGKNITSDSFGGNYMRCPSEPVRSDGGTWYTYGANYPEVFSNPDWAATITGAENSRQLAQIPLTTMIAGESNSYLIYGPSSPSIWFLFRHHNGANCVFPDNSVRRVSGTEVANTIDGDPAGLTGNYARP